VRRLGALVDTPCRSRSRLCASSSLNRLSRYRCRRSPGLVAAHVNSRSCSARNSNDLQRPASPAGNGRSGVTQGQEREMSGISSTQQAPARGTAPTLLVDMATVANPRKYGRRRLGQLNRKKRGAAWAFRLASRGSLASGNRTLHRPLDRGCCRIATLKCSWRASPGFAQQGRGESV
jgi:hypothetical protein